MKKNLSQSPIDRVNLSEHTVVRSATMGRFRRNPLLVGSTFRRVTAALLVLTGHRVSQSPIGRVNLSESAPMARCGSRCVICRNPLLVGSTFRS